MLGPFERRSVVVHITDVEPGPSFYEQPDDFEVSGECGLMQRRRVCMGSRRVVPVGILTGIEQQPDDVGMAVLSREPKSQMALVVVSRGKGFARRLDLARRRRSDQVDTSATTDQCLDRLPFTVDESRPHGAIRTGTEVAQQVDERDLHAALARHAARTHETERHVHRSLIGASARLEDGASYLDDVRRQAVVTNRILRHELEQRRLAKVVAPFEHDVLLDQTGMLREVLAQAVGIAVIEQLDGSTKGHVLDALVMGSIERIARRVRHV